MPVKSGCCSVQQAAWDCNPLLMVDVVFSDCCCNSRGGEKLRSAIFRNFPQFRNFSQFSAIFRNFSAIFPQFFAIGFDPPRPQFPPPPPLCNRT